MNAQTLHIVTPSSSLDTKSLVARQAATYGDLIADLSQSPTAIYEVDADQVSQDITVQVLGISDPRATVRDWLLQFTEQTGLQDELAIDGYGFWWSLNSLQFSPALSDLGNSFAWIDALIALREQRQPTSLIVYGQHAPIVEIATQVFKSTERKVQIEGRDRSTTRRGSTKHPGLLIARLLLGIVYLIYSLIWHPQVCVFANTNSLRKQALGSKQRLWDIFMGDTVQAFRTRGWRTTIVERYGWNASWHGLVARRFFLPGEVVEFFGLPILFKVGMNRRTVQKWHQKWQKIQPALGPHLQYKGIDLSSLALPLIALQFKQKAPSYEVTIGIWRKILRIWRPQILCVNTSYTPPSMVAIVAARQLGIPTMEIQHGVIGRNHIAYLVPERLTTRTKVPHCDTMMVWGEYTKRLLVDQHVYESDEIIVTGSPRMDVLLDDLPSRGLTMGQLGIPSDRQVVLYASNMPADGFRDQVLDSIRQGPDAATAHWIIKLHPREKTRDAWESGIGSRGLVNAMVIEGEADFYALLAACDLHVSYISTTLIEAAVLGKPNLGLSTAKSVDSTGFLEAQAFLPVDPADLGPAIDELLENPHLRKQLLTEQKAFADDWCLHDGQAVKRIESFVHAVIEAD